MRGLECHRHWLEYNIKMDVRNIECEGADRYVLILDGAPVAGPCEHGDDPFVP
jgi:hypothetical protein